MTSNQFRRTRTPIPVLLTVRKLDCGGIERDVTKMAVGFDRRRFSPHIAVFRGGGLRADEVMRAGIPVLDLEVSSLASPRILSSAVKFCRWVIEKQIRVVHAYDASAIFAVPLARLVLVPLVLSSTLGDRNLYDERTRKQLPFSDRLADGIVVNCQAMRRHMIADYAMAPERTILCYNGVETSEFYPKGGLKPDPVANASLVIGSLCVLRPEKRIDLLIEAFAPLRQLQRGLKLLIVGSGPELPKLRMKAAELKVEQDCIFHPAVPNVAPYLRAMDIFVSCSSSEAFSNSLLEAMACGSCPVGSRVGGTPELIEDRTRGLLFESGNLNELSEKLATLIQNPSLRARLAAKAAEFAAQNLNMQTALNRIGEIYEQGLAKKGKRQ